MKTDDFEEELVSDEEQSEELEETTTNRRRLSSALLLLLVIMILVFLALSFGKASNLNHEREALGLQAVKLLYDFGTVAQLDDQMSELKLITTTPIYNDLTIDNEERTLNTYLKFKNKSVTVNVIKSTSAYVLYSLKTEELSEDRVFMFLFETNKVGKISWVREMEVIDFLENAN